jgi:hypothetical protein
LDSDTIYNNLLSHVGNFGNEYQGVNQYETKWIEAGKKRDTAEENYNNKRDTAVASYADGLTHITDIDQFRKYQTKFKPLLTDEKGVSVLSPE